MQVSGKIIILVDDKPDWESKQGNRIQYGFVKIKGMENVFFNTLTSFQDVIFEDLKVGDRVRITVKQTDRGPFAESLTLSKRHLPKNISSPQKASL